MMGARLLMLLVCLHFMPVVVLAQFDLSSYQTVELASDSIPGDFFYPEYFKESERVSYANLLAELKFRFEFVAGIRPEPKHYNCYKMQKRIEKSLERMKAALGQLPFKRIDDQLLFAENSPLADYLKPMPRKATLKCCYCSIGDLDAGGDIYCVYHGPAEDSAFYVKNRERFEAARPFINAFEIVEMLIFLPALLIVPITWFFMKKVLEKN